MLKLHRNHFIGGENSRAWMKYCGFLDLTTDDFMAIQRHLLAEQIEHIFDSRLGNKLMGNVKPRGTRQFRRSVPLTVYSDYLPEIEDESDGVLPERPYVWCQTLSGSADAKQIPFTRAAYHQALDSLMAAFILACSRRRGASSLLEGDRVLFNVAPQPYLSGVLAQGASRHFPLQPVMPPGVHDDLDFKEKVAQGFKLSLTTGVDVLVAMSSVLVKMGRDFSRLSDGKRTRGRHHPAETLRLLRALVQSKLARRGILPRDLWRPKALLGWGIDAHIYRDEIYRYWGLYPYEFHACSEVGLMALQSWNQRDLTLLPTTCFYEFIPESELRREKEIPFYRPATVLLPELCSGEHYELVVTSFHGMPFVRYRLGHLIQVTALADDEAGVALPQIVYEGRTDDLIDIAGFTRISEKSVAQALANCDLDFEDWLVRKETVDGRPLLHLYLEPRNRSPEPLASRLHRELGRVDRGYRDLTAMMEIDLIRVSLLAPGTFDGYYRDKLAAGWALAACKPPRMNASDAVIRDVCGLQDTIPAAVA